MRTTTLVFFLSVLFALSHSSRGDLIADTCKKTNYTQLCVSTLRADPGSKTADVKGLARIVLEVVVVKSNATLNRVLELSRNTSDIVQIQSLAVCAQKYIDAVGYANEAIRNLGFGDSSKDLTSGVIDAAVSCDRQFTESPLTTYNLMVYELGEVALGIIKL